MRAKLILCAASLVGASAMAADAGPHWAFRAIERPGVPERASEDPVSWFVQRRLEIVGLQPAPQAARRDWIRRLHYNLTGLPPDFESLQRWLAAPEDDAALAERLVDQLLASPHYGERWARLWLDVARYSDTKGYAYSPEEFAFPHAWPYRDWVVGAFNTDLPYDQFVQRQLAADLLLEKGLCDRSDLAAMGFLTLGRRFVSVEPDIIDDRIDVVTRGVLGLTVSCARCHDHKFDPVPTSDYYALYGVFKSSREELVPIDPAAARAHAELEKKKASLAANFEKHAAELEARFLDRAAKYMLDALDIAKVPPPDFAEIIEEDDLNPAQTRRWYEFLSQASRREDPVFSPWFALIEGMPLDEIVGADPLVMAALADLPAGDLVDVAGRYGELFKNAEGGEGAEWQALREVVTGGASPIRVPRDYIHDVEWLFTEKTKEAIKKQLAELEREIIKLGEAAPHALVLVDRPVALDVNVFNRGQYPDQGEHVRRGSVSVLGSGRREGFRNGSGRLALARQLTSKKNPLTARVIANRIWRAHFAEGLVRTESDFGLRSDPPSHPELLDYLAAELIDSGWSIKHLQRLIATSSIYRMAAATPPAADAGNRFLSVYPRRRLGFEAMRDSMLAASGELDLRVGGPPGPLFGAGSSTRRSLYGRIDRQFLPSTLRVFDFANPELHTPRRYRTNVPQQALFLMNAPFTTARSKALAARVGRELPDGEPSQKVRRLFEHVYARPPHETELANSVRFVTAQPQLTPEAPPNAAAKAWAYGFGAFDQERGGIVEFKPLPHFSGSAWGGGTSWPDAALGWVQLTADGGHVGNDVNHAAVRRWKAPDAGQIDISGAVAKIEDCGDGVRAWISSSRQGALAVWRVEFGNAQSTDVADVEVEQGEVIDFVVDCGEAGNFSCDGFTWSPRIQLRNSERVWDALRDFSGQETAVEPLDVWARLAQALLISNEAMFLD